MVEFEKNVLKLDNNIVKEFNFYIRDIILLDNKIIILLEIPYDNNTEKNNILAVDFKGDIVWTVDNSKYTKNIFPFEQMNLEDNNLFASDFYARRVKIDINTGKIKDVLITK